MAVTVARASHVSDAQDTVQGRDGLLARFVDALKRSRQAAAERHVRRFVDELGSGQRSASGGPKTFV